MSARRPAAGRRRRASLLAVAVASATSALGAPLPALAADTINEPPVGSAIIAFPERDFVEVGAPAGTAMTIELVRGTTVIGTARGVASGTTEPGLEVNHPGGVCWDGFTPDVLAGDKVRVTTGDINAPDRTFDQTTVAHVAVTQPATRSEDGGTITIRGTARTATGGPIDIDQLEARLINGDGFTGSDNRRRYAAPGEGTLAYDAPGSTTWTATFPIVATAGGGILEADVAKVLSTDTENRILWLGVNPLSGAELTIFEYGLTGGPGMPECPPARSYAIGSTNPTAVNLATQGEGLVVSGVSADATAVSVTLDDTDPATPAATATGTVAPATADTGESWTATFTSAEVLGLQDGVLTATPTFTVAGSPLVGAAKTLLKDLVAPPAPVATPAGGAYQLAQSVTLSDNDPAATNAVRYTVNGAEPTSTTGFAYTSQISVTADQAIRSRAFDPAGNPSTVQQDDYVIDPQAPSISLTAPAGGATVSGSAVAISANASDNKGVVGVQFEVDGVAHGAEDTEAPYSATWDTTALANGTTHTLAAVARDAAGNTTRASERTVTVSNAPVDSTGPTVALTSPAAGAVVAGTAVTVAATASDSGGVAGVQFRLDGVDLGAEDTVAPYSVAWNTTTATDGAHALTAVARDAAGNVTTSAPVSVTVGNATTDGTAPTVTARTPAVDGTGFPVAGNVTVTFSEAVTGVSGASFQLRNATTGALVPATVSRNGTTNQWILNPGSNLAADTRYTASLSGAIRDGSGTALAATSWSFSTGPAPRVTARAPGINGTSVPVGGNTTATFSEVVNGVSASTFQLRNATTGALVSATVSRNGTTNQWILNPGTNLAPDTRYTVTLTGGPSAIRDRIGNPLANTSWSFTTGPAPTVTGRSPGSGATGVSRTANVAATFSEAVQGVAGSTFQLRNAATGALVSATVSRNGTTNQWILNPGVTLPAGTRFTVTLTGGPRAIRDLAGNPLARTTWSFTTGR